MKSSTQAEQVQQAFDAVLGQPVILGKPKHEKFGDYAINVMQLSPRPSQEEIASYIEKLAGLPLFEKVQLDGAYINVFISHTMLHDSLAEVLSEKDTYGSSDWGTGKSWGIEHTSPNPNKAMHLGHLRNNVTGMAVTNLLEFVGVNVVPDEVDNNRGIAIARLMWGYLHYGASASVKKGDKTLAYWFEHQTEWDTPESRSMDPGRFVDELYVKASVDFKEDEAIQQEVRQMVVDWEAKDEKTWALWEKVLAYSYSGQEKTLKRLGNRWDHVWHEHEHYQQGKDYVEEGLAKGIFLRTPEGTIITQLEMNYGIPDTVVQKSDGTSLYITQDLALTKLKLDTYKADHLFWVIGPEQGLALKQLFAVCEQLGIGTLDQFTHISYGLMSIKGKGRMNSRSGNVVFIDDLLDEAASRAKQAIREPEKLSEPLEDVAEKICVGAVKYSLLKVGRNQDTAFDFDESLSFEGNSGPYIQYAYARMMSVGKKAGLTGTKPEQTPTSLEEPELLLLRALARFPEVVLQAATTYSPHEICTYLFDLTQKFNVFYEVCSILEAPADLKAFRLALTQATAQVVKNGLRLLGIGVLERM